MHYLSPQDILIIHAKIIDEIGGLHGVRDIGLLISLIQQVKSRFYKGIFEKTAVYLDFLARHHIFSDANKRISIASAARFLFLNSYELKATNKQIEKFVLNVVINKPDIKTIAKWIRDNSQKI